MPIHKQAPPSSFSIESPDLEAFCIDILIEEATDSAWVGQRLSGEIVCSFDVADTPGGWHLVWLDGAIEAEGLQTAHVAVAARWVARQLKVGVSAPIHIRILPDVSLVGEEVIDIDTLPVLGRGTGELREPEDEEPGVA